MNCLHIPLIHEFLKQWYNSKQLELYMFGWVGERTELI